MKEKLQPRKEQPRKVAHYSKRPAINNVGPFSQIYDPPPSPCQLMLLPYVRHYNPLVIRNPSRILTIHKAKGHST